MAVEIKKIIKYSDLPASTAQENSDILSVEKADGSFYKTTRQAFLQAILDGKQDKLTFDTTPTAGSTKPVTSGGIKAALDRKADKTALSGFIYIGDDGQLYDKEI